MRAPQTFEEVDVFFPDTLDAALIAQADPNRRGRVLAGGTDLMVQWEAGVVPLPPRVISIKHLPVLRQIEENPGMLIIGAGVTHKQLRASPLVRQYLPSLAEAAATIGGEQIQVMGTIGGSVANASPAGDLAPSLMVAEGDVVLASVRGERRVPVTACWTGYRQIDCAPDELIVRFELTKMPAGYREGWRKLGPRQAQAISKIMGSFRGQLTDGIITDFKVAVGSVAPTCIRLYELEQWLVGKPCDAATCNEAETRARAGVHPIDDIRSTAAYRQWVTGRMIRSFLQTLEVK